MKNIVKITDMLGFFNVSGQNPNLTTMFDTVALEMQEKVLRGDGGYCDYGLLGDQEYIKLLNDLDIDGQPQTQPYISLVNGINYVNQNNKSLIFGGLRKMLKGFVYFAYHESVFSTNTPMGQRVQKVENTEDFDLIQARKTTAERFNASVDLHNKEVYDYINFYKSTYFPDWNFTGKYKKLINGFSS